MAELVNDYPTVLAYLFISLFITLFINLFPRSITGGQTRPQWKDQSHMKCIFNQGEFKVWRLILANHRESWPVLVFTGETENFGHMEPSASKLSILNNIRGRQISKFHNCDLAMLPGYLWPDHSSIGPFTCQECGGFVVYFIIILFV